MKKFFELGVRLLSVVYFVSIIHDIIITVTFFTKDYFEHNLASFLTLVFLYISSFILTLILSFKPQILSTLLRIEEDKIELGKKINYSELLRVGLVLIGFYFFMIELFNLFRDIPFHSLYIQGGITYTIMINLKRISVFFLTMMLIYHSKSVANYLLKSKNNSDE